MCYSNKGTAPHQAVPPSYYVIFPLRAEMITACRDDPEAPWRLIRIADGAPTSGGSRALLEWAKSKAARQAGGGVDQAELDRFVKRVVHLFTRKYQEHEKGLTTSLPEACSLLRDAMPSFHRSVDLFDFSERHSLSRACEVVTRVDDQELPSGPLLVLPVGDALQEPFWPEGLGINRGMHNALDAVWTGHHWPTAKAMGVSRQSELVGQRQALHESKTLQMHGKNRSMLRGYRADNSRVPTGKPAMAYSPDPATRYNAPLHGIQSGKQPTEAEIDVVIKR